MNWTLIFALKALVFVAVAIATPFVRADLYQEQLGWTLVATYALTGIVLLMFGMLLDVRESALRPQQIEVLLRHEGKAWLLTVMRNSSGELYAPADADMRKLRPVDLAKVPPTVLCSPKFTQSSHSPNQYMILGEFYAY